MLDGEREVRQIKVASSRLSHGCHDCLDEEAALCEANYMVVFHHALLW